MVFLAVAPPLLAKCLTSNPHGILRFYTLYYQEDLAKGINTFAINFGATSVVLYGILHANVVIPEFFRGVEKVQGWLNNL